MFPGVHAVPNVDGYRYIRVYTGTTGSGGSYEIFNRRRDQLQVDPVPAERFIRLRHPDDMGQR